MEPRKENKLGTMPVGRLLVSVSLPLMISMLVQAAYNIVDSMYVARISEDALAATSLAFPAQILMIAVGVGTGVGVNALLARKLGEKRFEEADRVADNGLFLALCSGAVFAVLGLTLTRPFLSAFVSPDMENAGMIVDYGVEYLSVCMTGSVGLFLGIMNERLLQATGKSMLSMISQLVGAVTNIILDPVLIFGLGIFPEMGIRGAAIATVIGQFVGCFTGIAFNLTRNKDIHVSLRGFRPDPIYIGFIYQVGIPNIVMQSISSLMYVCMNKILIPFSTTAVAVFGVYYKLESFVFMPVFGLTQGLIPIIGYNYGARRPDRMMRAYKAATGAALVLTAVGFAVFQLAPDWLLRLYNASEAMKAIGAPALRIISFTFIPAAVSIVAGSTLTGMGNGMVSMFESLLRQLVLLLPCAYLLARFSGLDSVWFSFCIAEVASLVFTMWMFLLEYRKKIRPLEAEEAREAAQEGHD